MRTLPLLGLILVLTSVFGIYYRSKNGVIRKKRRLHISQGEFAGSYGSRATILQFSTTFCSQCRAAKSLIADVIKNQSDISYIEIDAESNLDTPSKSRPFASTCIVAAERAARAEWIAEIGSSPSGSTRQSA